MGMGRVGSGVTRGDSPLPAGVPAGARSLNRVRGGALGLRSDGVADVDGGGGRESNPILALTPDYSQYPFVVVNRTFGSPAEAVRDGECGSSWSRVCDHGVTTRRRVTAGRPRLLRRTFGATQKSTPRAGG